MQCNEFHYLRHLIAAYTQWQIDNQQKQSGNNVCVWGKNLGGIKGTLECSCLHCLQYSKEIPARLSQNITTLPSGPDTPCSTASAAVAEKFRSCTCFGYQLSSTGYTTSWACSSENTGKWIVLIRIVQFSQLLPSVRLST